MTPVVHCYSQAASRLAEIIEGEVGTLADRLQPRRIVIKPNWVMHETDPAFPIGALVTDPRVIEATIRACAASFPAAEQIIVGDCPEQRADWPLMCRQSGLAPVIEAMEKEFAGRVEFRDLRKDVYKAVGDRLVPDADARHGDPAGYREIELKDRSHLEPIAREADRFSIHDHDVHLTRTRHRPGDHRYLVCQTVLDADLVLNLPKWKAHSKSGLTGALKNLVGINGDKSYLPHFRRGSPRWGGDEYSDEGRWLYWVQNSVSELVGGTVLRRMLRPGWKLVKQINNAVRRRDATRSSPADFYVVGGSWYGNQTLWRMIYDLNLVVQHADRSGQLRDTPQRACFCIVDGLTSGEGDGPLKPVPRDTDMLVCGNDPFAIDAALAWFMGFDAACIPMLSERSQYMGAGWGRFDADRLEISMDGRTRVLEEVELDFGFAPPPGWIGHVERGSRLVQSA